MNDIIVLGAGIAGISATFHLKEKEIDAICYEKDNKLGGLLSNFTINGYRFDNAVHLSFTNNEYVKSIFSQTEYYVHAPVSFCFEYGIWLRHPVQNNLFPLTTKEKVKLISSFYDAPKKYGNNYKSWLLHQYGERLAERYPINYTRKYWDIEPENLSLTWIGNRIRKSNLEEILRGAFESREDNHYYATEMRYPKKGGYFSFIKPLTESINVKLNKKVIKININNRTVIFSDGDTIHYDKLINTIPLPEIIKTIDDIPREVEIAAESLLYTKIDLISVGFSRKIENDKLWFYIYTDCIAARAYSPSLKSPDSVPEGCSSLQFEIYTLSGKVSPSKEKMINDVKEYLLKSKICQENDIAFLHHKHIRYGNVVYNHGMEERRQIILDYLEKNNIFSAGRFGEWAYLWSDQALLSGKRIVERIINE